LCALSTSFVATDSKGARLATTGEFITVTRDEGTLTINIPVTLEKDGTLDSFTDDSGLIFADNRLVIPATVAAGMTNMIRVVDEEGIVLGQLVIETKEAVGTGSTATAEVESILVHTQFTERDFTVEDPALGEVQSSIQLTLSRLPREAEVKVTTALEADPQAQSVFQLLANSVGMKDVDVAYVINISKTNLENDTDIKNAAIIMKAGTEWVEAHGGVNEIKIFRYDPETQEQEILETSFIGHDEQGRAIFEGISPNGLSVFGLMGIAPGAMTAPFNWPLIVGIIAGVIIVAGLIVFFSIRKKT